MIWAAAGIYGKWWKCPRWHNIENREAMFIIKPEAWKIFPSIIYNVKFAHDLFKFDWNDFPGTKKLSKNGERVSKSDESV